MRRLSPFPFQSADILMFPFPLRHLLSRYLYPASAGFIGILPPQALLQLAGWSIAGWLGGWLIAGWLIAGGRAEIQSKRRSMHRAGQRNKKTRTAQFDIKW